MSGKLDKNGEVKSYYRMRTVSNASINQLASRLEYSGVSKGELVKVLYGLADAMRSFLSDGYSVTLDGLGTFRVSIGEKKMSGYNSKEERDKHERNSSSLEVKGIIFKADPKFVNQVQRDTKLERGGVSRLRKSPYSAEERHNLAIEYLKKHTLMHVKDYERITQLSHTVASAELRKLANDPASCIVSVGRGSHKVYILREA